MKWFFNYVSEFSSPLGWIVFFVSLIPIYVAHRVLKKQPRPEKRLELLWRKCEFVLLWCIPLLSFVATKGSDWSFDKLEESHKTATNQIGILTTNLVAQSNEWRATELKVLQYSNAWAEAKQAASEAKSASASAKSSAAAIGELHKKRGFTKEQREKIVARLKTVPKGTVTLIVPNNATDEARAYREAFFSVFRDADWPTIQTSDVSFHPTPIGLRFWIRPTFPPPEHGVIADVFATESVNLIKEFNPQTPVGKLEIFVGNKDDSSIKERLIDCLNSIDPKILQELKAHPEGVHFSRHVPSSKRSQIELLANEPDAKQYVVIDPRFFGTISAPGIGEQKQLDMTIKHALIE